MRRFPLRTALVAATLILLGPVATVAVACRSRGSTTFCSPHVATLLGEAHVTRLARDDAVAIAPGRIPAGALTLTTAPWQPRS